MWQPPTIWRPQQSQSPLPPISAKLVESQFHDRRLCIRPTRTRLDGAIWFTIDLVVTLLVIVTAAWVTGQRVPASKSIDTETVVIAEDSQSLVDSLSTTDLSNLDDTESHLAQTSPAEQPLPAAPAKESTVESTTIPPTNVVAKPAIDQPLTESIAVNSVPTQPAQEMSATLALEAPRSVHDDPIASLADAPTGL